MQNKGTLESHVCLFHHVFQDHTIIQQVIVETCWRREPQHPPLHKARNVSIVVQYLQNVRFLDRPKRLQTSNRGCHDSMHKPSWWLRFCIEKKILLRPVVCADGRQPAQMDSQSLVLEATAKTCVPALELKTHAAEDVCLQVSHALHCDLKGKTNAQHPKPCGHSFP